MSLNLTEGRSSRVFDMASSWLHAFTTDFNLSQGFLVFLHLHFLFRRCSGWIFTPGPVAVCCSTPHQTDSRKAATFGCLPLGWPMLVPPLCPLGCCLALTLWECLRSFMPGDRIFIGPMDLYRLWRHPKWLFCTFGKTETYPHPHISTGLIILLPWHLPIAPRVLLLSPLVTSVILRSEVGYYTIKILNVSEALLIR